MTRNKRLSAALGLLGATLMGVAGGGWACTIQASIVGISPAAAPERTMVRVAGEGMAAGAHGGRMVEVRWDGVNGALLGTGSIDTDGLFRANVVVPAAAPGVYSLVVVADGAGVGRGAFEVTSRARAESAQAPPLTQAQRHWDRTPTLPAPSGTSTGKGMIPGVVVLATGITGIGIGSILALARRRRLCGSRRSL